MHWLRRIILMLALTAAIVASCAAFNYLLNPYGAWRIALVDPVFRKIKEERVATPWLLRAAAPETVLVGSSRVLIGMRIRQGARDGVMNAALRAATIPQMARIVALALANPRLKSVVWGIDFLAFNPGWGSDDPLLEARFAGSREVLVEDTLLSLDALRDGFALFRRSQRGRDKLPPTATASVPWSTGLICEELNARQDDGLRSAVRAEVTTQLSTNYYAHYRFSTRLLRLFRDTVNKARARHVDVILFVPPMSQYELELIRQDGLWVVFQNFKRALASVGPFWDFSGYNDIARSDELFLDVMHIKTAVGADLLRIVLGMDAPACGQRTKVIAHDAVRVEARSLDGVLAAQNRMREAATNHESRYSQVVTAALRVPAPGRLEGVDGSAVTAGGPSATRW